MSGAVPLAEGSEDLEQEDTLLIDPAQTDPTDHISFCEDPTVSRWVAVPTSQSALGRETISVLGLDQDDQLNAHVDDRVRIWADQLLDVVKLGDAAEVAAVWDRMCRSLFAPRQPFHALTRDALAILIPKTVRASFCLEFPKLGRCV